MTMAETAVAAATETKGRTAEDKVLQEPIRVTLGGAEYTIPLLPYIEAKEFRKQYLKLLKHMAPLSDKDKENPADVLEMLSLMGEQMPDECVDLFFVYAKSLPRQHIEETATEPELQVAVGEVFRVANPLSWADVISG